PGKSGVEELADRFRDLHLRTYGHASADQEVEVVNVRLSAFGALPIGAGVTAEAPYRQEAVSASPAEPAPESARVGEVTARLPGASSAVPLFVYHRERIEPGQCVAGPAIVHQLDSTTVVLPGQRARVDTQRSMWLEESG
ncbi:MAG: hypothetical protein LBV34_01495, partial [Nocardiopsaceae bacterium]|nr:hypothetical protein [Nocardiopsaceae bacterium]